MRPSTIDALLSTLINGEATGRRQLTFTALGGAYNRVPDTATAFVHRSSLFYISIVSVWEHDDETDVNVAWTDDLAASLQPYLSGEVYQNYADEDLVGWPAAYYGANYPRLQHVKQEYDRTDFFRHPQSIRPA